MIRVLLVANHVSMRNTVRTLLQRSGEVNVVGQARDGEQALREVERLKPDVVVMDVVMPLMDGFKVLRAIGRMPDGPQVVIFSANESEVLAQRALAEGASAFVAERLAFAQLVEAVIAVASR